MVSPPQKENNPQFVRMASALADAGVHVPEILAHQSAHGYMLLSDLGVDHLIDAYRRGNTMPAVQAALATLPLIQDLRADFIPPYTQSRFSDELNVFVDWLVVAACDTPLPTDLFESARTLLLANAQDQPTLCVHRDYHCRNLLLQQDGSVGVLDFQDALMGPAHYDLASLLHDCYWALDAEIIAACDGPNSRQVDLLAAQRQLKALGIFARLYLRDGKASHLRYILPVLRRLINLCTNSAELRPLSTWLAESLLPCCTHWVGSQTGSAQT
jgi:aminoglycoside/choline kinase family phosphotransferase